MTLATVSITDLRREAGKLLQRAKEEPLVITRQGRPQAVILDYVEYKRLKERLAELEGQEAMPAEMLAPSLSQSKIRTLIRSYKANMQDTRLSPRLFSPKGQGNEPEKPGTIVTDAVPLADELGATVVTGDPEFKKVESVVAVLWLRGV